jgi:hypothetical protein
VAEKNRGETGVTHLRDVGVTETRGAHPHAHLTRPRRMDGQVLQSRPRSERVEHEPARLQNVAHCGQEVTVSSHIWCQALVVDCGEIGTVSLHVRGQALAVDNCLVRGCDQGVGAGADAIEFLGRRTGDPLLHEPLAALEHRGPRLRVLSTRLQQPP